jgi:hypothetical protein
MSQYRSWCMIRTISDLPAQEQYGSVQVMLHLIPCKLIDKIYTEHSQNGRKRINRQIHHTNVNKMCDSYYKDCYIPCI